MKPIDPVLAQLWRGALVACAGDARPWLVIPSDPCRSDAHTTVTYAELSSTALRIGRVLYGLGLNHGDRVVVIADNSVAASMLVFASLASGLVAVPVPPQTLGMSRERWIARLAEICADCTPSCVTGSQVVLPSSLSMAEARVHSYEDLVECQDNARSLPDSQPDDLALIQYTSGTTERPRGVELTHRNIFHNLWAIGRAIDMKPEDVGLTWLPLFHDMGLIGSLLFAAYWRAPLVLLTPRTFLMRPEAWLWAISRFRVTCCAAPNSAYQMLCSKVPERKLLGVDLSSWRVAFNGSELVHPATVEGFCQRFAAHGFRAKAMYPVYGLAENTVATCFPSHGEAVNVDWIDRDILESQNRAVAVDAGGGERVRGIVSVGRALPNQQLRVVDGAFRTDAAEREVGDVEVRGICVMRGYHRAAKSGPCSMTGDGWLRTGDEGYIADGQLYLVGRSKEIVNRAGRKYDAADIQTTVKNLPGARGFVAAFGVDSESSGTEALVIMLETQLDNPHELAELEANVAKSVRRVFAIAPDSICFVVPGTIPRTTSGKIQHNQARILYSKLHREATSKASGRLVSSVRTRCLDADEQNE